MLATCSTEKNDVKNAVKAMKKDNHSGSLVQVGKRVYGKLEGDQGGAPAVAGERTKKHIINRSTGLIHRYDCRVVTYISSECRISAALVNVGATGLKTCKVCM
ncbi:MAG: hypothetical protein V3T88_03200 [Nitrosomonadaceae bacterium]